MTMKAVEARAKEMLDKSSRLGVLVQSAGESIADLRRFIKALRAEGCQWDEIGKVLGIPGYCVMVIDGQTKGKRMLPEYARAKQR